MLGIEKVQFVWWWAMPYFKWWSYGWFRGKPIFWGLYLGIVEIRFYPNSPDKRRRG